MAFSDRLVLAAVLATASLAAAGCDFFLGHDLNKKFCEAHPADEDCRRAFYVDAGPRACTANEQCSAPMGVCDLDVGGSMTCVECTTSEPGACMAATPACVDHSCQKCTEHTQCATSNVCLPDGACADMAQVAYVDPAGSDNPTCAKATPCTKVASALATNRPYVKFHGTTDEAVTVNGGRVVAFLAAPGAKLTRTTGTGAIVTVQGDGTALSVYDLSISDAPNSPSGIGCVIPAASGAPTLSLTRARLANNPGGGLSATGGTVTVSQSTVSGNTGNGLSATGGTVTVSQSTVSGNTGGGLSATGGTVTVSQSTVSGNTGGGLSISGAQFDLTNNFIVNNGSPGAVFGGVRIDGIATSTGVHRLELDTITGNQASAALTAGVTCSAIAVPLSFANNIVFRNGLAMQVEGTNCTWSYSDIGQALASGTGNINQDPMFVNLAQNDFHIQSGSPAKNAANPAATISVDFDGNTRPQDGRSDMGADEWMP